MTLDEHTYGWPDVLAMSLACRYTGRSRWTLRRAIAVGDLTPAGKRGRTLAFLRSELDRWMIGTPIATPSSATSPAKRARDSTDDALARLKRIRTGGQP